jgi:hypothetical protein
MGEDSFSQLNRSLPASHTTSVYDYGTRICKEFDSREIAKKDRNQTNGQYGTVKVGNFDHLMTFKIVLKIFPNSFITIFLHENVRVLWYFWDPNLNTRFGSQK